MEQWLNENLAQVLEFPIPDNIIQYILQIENERDLTEFFSTFLDCANEEHKQFIAELKKRKAWNQVGYKKVNDIDDNSKKQPDKKKGKLKGKESKENKQVQEVAKVEKVQKKKTTYVNLYSQDGKDTTTILLKGRHKCNCEAKSHKLINNCLNCGRIVCMQEGAGPCLFCGEIVCSLKEQSILSSNTKQSEKLYNKLINQKMSKSLEESIRQRDTLLEYDRSGVQCTKVIDDECDYYQTNNTWLTTKQREKIQKMEQDLSEKKHMSRLNKKISVTFDFAGRQVTEDKPVDDFNEFNEEEFLKISNSFSEIESSNICPTIEFDRPMYIESDEPKMQLCKPNRSMKLKNVIQDKEYLEISDAGLCLSMHQPYASLLVAGIKAHEGRTWYSAHRGRLWIAATSKPPSTEEISAAEQYYRVLKDEKLMFPETYPTSCLLGCVTVVDVLSQEKYRPSYPEGESDSPYVFICDNFHTLPIRFPIRGQHKIYKLDPKIHHAAVKMLENHQKNAKRN